MSKEVRSWKKVYLGDLESLISEFKDALDKPSVVILTGEVGSGKTSFVQTYQRHGGFWLAATNASQSESRWFGRTNILVSYSDYRIN